MSIGILTWNIQAKRNKTLKQAIYDVVDENDVDIFVVQEYYGRYINTLLKPHFEELDYGGQNKKTGGTRIFLRTGKFTIQAEPQMFWNKLALVRLTTIGTKYSFTLAGVHLHSKVNSTERKQLWGNRPIAQHIQSTMNLSGWTDNVVIIGDLNQNPYDSDIGDPNVFNTMNNRDLIDKFFTRKARGKPSKHWYNPMFNMLGDQHPRKSQLRVNGTYYFVHSFEKPRWNLIDGALLSYSMRNAVNFQKSYIIERTVPLNFIKPFVIKNNESMIHDEISDHLPLLITLNI